MITTWLVLNAASGARNMARSERVSSTRRMLEASPLFQKHHHTRRQLSNACDEKFNVCMQDVSGCFACVTEVLMYAGDDDLELPSSDEFSCDDVVDQLHEFGLCERLSPSSATTLCELWSECAEQSEDDFFYYGDDGDDADEACDEVMCDVPHLEWLGDAYCDGGCYNTEACGYDGGDCCKETCRDTPTTTCGDKTEFHCLDPSHLGCGHRSEATYELGAGDGEFRVAAVFDMSGAADDVPPTPVEFLPTGEVSGGTLCLGDGCYVVEADADLMFSSGPTFVVQDARGAEVVGGVGPGVCLFSMPVGAPTGNCADALKAVGAAELGCFSETYDDECDANYLMVMKDEGRDGWGDDVAYEVANGDAVVRRGTLKAGHMDVHAMCITTPGCYTVTLSFGWFSSEVSWTLGLRDRGKVGEGGAPFRCQFPVGGGGDDDKCDNTCLDPPACDAAASSYMLAIDGGSAAVISTTDSYSKSFDATDMVCLAADACYRFEFTGSDQQAWGLGSSTGILIAGSGTADCVFSIDGAACADDTRQACGVDGRFAPSELPRESESPLQNFCPAGTQNVTAELYDTWGDGWNDASIEVYDQADGTQLKDVTLQTGAYGKFFWCLPSPGCYAVKVTSGLFHEEVAWRLTAPRASLDLDPVVITFGNAPEACVFRLPTPDSYLEDHRDELGACRVGCWRQDTPNDDWNVGTDDFWFYGDDTYYGYYGFYGGDDECSRYARECQQVAQVERGYRAVEAITACVEDVDTDGSLDVFSPLDLSLWYGKPDLCTDTYDWRELEEFEACAAEVRAMDPSDNAKGPKAQECMKTLVAAAYHSNDDKMENDTLVLRLATTVYYFGDIYCDCVSDDEAVPDCGEFVIFRAVVRESHEACDALDYVDCPYLGYYADRCLAMLGDDWDANACTTIQNVGCRDEKGNLMPIPSVRDWDCLYDDDNHEMSPKQKAFYTRVCERCDGGYDCYYGGDTPDRGRLDDDGDDVVVVEATETTKKKKKTREHASAGRTVLIVFLTLLLVALTAVIAVWIYKRRNSGEPFFMPISRQAVSDADDTDTFSYSLAPLHDKNAPLAGM